MVTGKVTDRFVCPCCGLVQVVLVELGREVRVRVLPVVELVSLEEEDYCRKRRAEEECERYQEEERFTEERRSFQESSPPSPEGVSGKQPG